MGNEDGTLRDYGDKMDKFIKGDYPVDENIDEEEALKRLSKKNMGVIVITVTPKFGSRNLTKVEDTFNIKFEMDEKKSNVDVIKLHLKKLYDSKVIDRFVEKIMEETKHA